MKKTTFYLLLIATILTVAIIGCGKDDLDGNLSTISAENVDVGDYHIATVKATINDDFEVASNKFQNNGFTLKLKKVPEEYLFFANSGLWEDIPLDIISDKNGKLTFLSILGYNNSGDYEIGFSLEDSNNGIVAFYVYADRKFSIQGKGRYNTYTCSFKKGWNIVYWGGGGERVTTNKPSNSNFKWYCSSLGWS